MWWREVQLGPPYSTILTAVELDAQQVGCATDCIAPGMVVVETSSRSKVPLRVAVREF